jgi:hypothetical protein
MAKTPHYQNYQVLSPEGKLMFRTSKERVDWYVNRNLAKVVDTDGFVAQLLFQPKGPGGIDDPFYTQEMVNQCVVCGKNDYLTRHHLVPFTYRRHFPKEIKANASYDVLTLCVDCHIEVERHALELKMQLAKEYNVPFDYGGIVNRDLAYAKKAAFALIEHQHKIPLKRIEELVDRIYVYLGGPPTTDDIVELSEANPYNFDNFKSHAELLFSKLTNLEEFVYRWRKHFLDCMKPKFLPKYWTWDRSIYRQGPYL